MQRTFELPVRSDGSHRTYRGRENPRWRKPIPSLRTGVLGREAAPSDDQSAIWAKIDSNKEIRLLNIQQDPSGGEPQEDVESESPIVCTLTTVLRIPKPAYKALSYTWGDLATIAAGSSDLACVFCAGRGTSCAKCPRTGPVIKCNGYPLVVTTNCYNALLTLRRCYIYGPIWIDAICINQRNVDERSAQVARIGEVFSQAEETIVCLCPEQLGLTAPVDPLPALRVSLGPGGERYFTQVDRQDLSDSSSSDRLRATVLLKPEVFYRSPWFTRTWIIQEVMLSTVLTFIPELERLPISWDDLNQAYSIWSRESFSWDVPDVIGFRREESGSIVCDNRGQAIFNLESHSLGTRSWYSPQQTQHSIPPQFRIGMDYGKLFEVLEKTRHFQCKEPADKIYAILPLFSDPVPANLSPNYSRRVINVFRDLTILLLLWDQPEILSLASLHGQPSDKPSWVVDWSDKTPQASRLELHHRIAVWSAGCWPRCRRMHISRTTNNVLIVRGRLVLNVNALSNGTQLCTRQHRAQAEDQVCIFLGFRVLFLLRPQGSGYRLVDECAIDGFMQGEGLLQFNPLEAYGHDPPSGMIDFEIH